MISPSFANDTGSNNPETEEDSVVTVERTMKEATNPKESNTKMNSSVRKGNNGEEVESIYLDDGSHKKKPETVKPQRKLTKVC